VGIAHQNPYPLSNAYQDPYPVGNAYQDPYPVGNAHPTRLKIFQISFMIPIEVATN
jgi:hypothetical protein